MFADNLAFLYNDNAQVYTALHRCFTMWVTCTIESRKPFRDNGPE